MVARDAGTGKRPELSVDDRMTQTRHLRAMLLGHKLTAEEQTAVKSARSMDADPDGELDGSACAIAEHYKFRRFLKGTPRPSRTQSQPVMLCVRCGATRSIHLLTSVPYLHLLSVGTCHWNPARLRGLST